MRRSWLVTTAAVIQTLGAIGLSGVVIYLLLPDEREGTLIAAGLLVLIAVPAIISCWGIWRSKAWGWWLAVMFNFAGLAAFLVDPITRRVWPDVDELAFIVIFIVAIVLLLLAPVRRFFLRSKDRLAETGAGS